MKDTQLKPIQAPTLEAHVQLLKSVFKNNDGLLKIVHLLFLGIDLTDSEKEIIKSTFYGKKELQFAIRRITYPVFEVDIRNLDIGTVADFWMDIDKELMGASRDAIYQRVQSKQLTLNNLEKAFKLLNNVDGEKIDLSYNADTSIDLLQVKLLARSLYIRTIVQAIGIIKQISNMEIETQKQKETRLKKDSAK